MKPSNLSAHRYAFHAGYGARSGANSGESVCDSEMRAGHSSYRLLSSREVFFLRVFRIAIAWTLDETAIDAVKSEWRSGNANQSSGGAVLPADD